MKRVTACHGVGRKPEDGKRLHIIELRLLSPVSRVPYFLLPNEGLTPLAMDMSPTYVGYKFRSLALANCPTNSDLSGCLPVNGQIEIDCKAAIEITAATAVEFQIGSRRLRNSNPAAA
mgnify:CR=1 FL=1